MKKSWRCDVLAMLLLSACPLPAGEDGAMDGAVQRDASPPRDVPAATDAGVPVLERAPRLTQSCTVSANAFADPGFFGRFQLAATSTGPVLAGVGGVYDAYWAKAYVVGASGALGTELLSLGDTLPFDAFGVAELAGTVAAVWHVYGNTNSLRFARVDGQGRSVVPPLDLPGTVGAIYSAELYSTPSGQRVFALYVTCDASSRALLMMAVLDATGALVVQPRQLAASSAELDFFAAVDSRGLSVVWGSYLGNYQLGFAVFGEDGAAVVEPRAIAPAFPAARQPTLAFVPGGYLLAWSGEWVIELAAMSAAGDVTGPVHPLASWPGQGGMVNGRAILVPLGDTLGLLWYESENPIIAGERTQPFHFVALHPDDLVPAGEVLTYTIQGGIAYRVRAAPLGASLFTAFGVAYHMGGSFESVNLTCVPR